MSEAQEAPPFFPLVVDNTMLSTWRRCPEEFHLRHCLGLIPADAAGRFSMDTHFGGMFAKGTETVRNAWLAGEPQPDAVITGIDAILRGWGIENPITDPFSERSSKTLANCLLALQDYFARWPLDMDDARIASIEGRPGVEWSGVGSLEGTQHPYLFDANGNPAHIQYAGRFDCILEYYGKCWGLDDKTSRALGDRWRHQWQLRGQFTGYCWLASLYGIRINTFLIRGIAPLVGSTSFDEVRITRAQHDIDRWLAQTTDDVNTMVAEWRSAKWRRILDNWCGYCKYLPMCKDVAPYSLLSDYIVDRWDPLQQLQNSQGEDQS